MQITRKVKRLIGIPIKCNETHISLQLPNFEVSSPFRPWVCALELLIKTLLKFSSFLCSLDRENYGKLFHFISFPSISLCFSFCISKEQLIIDFTESETKNFILSFSSFSLDIFYWKNFYLFAYLNVSRIHWGWNETNWRRRWRWWQKKKEEKVFNVLRKPSSFSLSHQFIRNFFTFPPSIPLGLVLNSMMLEWDTAKCGRKNTDNNQQQESH